MRPEAKPHYLPGNKITWSPPMVVYLKALTTATETEAGEVLTLHSWMARAVIRRGVKPGSWSAKFHHGRSALELADWLTEITRGHETCWVFTHNAAHDLVTTRLPLTLHAGGWEINDASLSGAAPWVRLARGSRRLAIADSFSYLPHTPQDLTDRHDLPYPTRAADESDNDWRNRAAKHDLDTVADSMADLLDWWDDNALGKWSIAGASTGYHAMRHIPSPHKIVIDPDPARIAADRAAIYGGRRGAWVVGTRTYGPFLELDFTNAYPSVGAGLPLPARRTKAFDSLPLTDWRLTSDRWGIIATVDLATNVPRWPVRFPGGTFAPVGQFRTTLAGPEIRDALRLGCLRSVNAGHVHQLNTYLQPWADWCLATIHDKSGNTPVAAQLAAKHWSRAVIGKFASRSYERIEAGVATADGWGYTEAWDHDTQTRGAFIELAGERWWSGVAGDAEQAYPGLFAWVESETRVRLTRVIEAVGERAVLQCDTDGLIVIERLLGTKGAGGHLLAPPELTGAARTKWVLDQLDPIIAPLTIRIKKTHKQISVKGPQHVKTNNGRKYSGIPQLATEGKEDEFTYRQWPGLPYQLASGSSVGYVRPEVTVRVRGPYAPGWVCSDGRVIPVECRIREDGTNQIVGWEAMTTKPKGAKRAQDQHPVLAALW